MQPAAGHVCLEAVCTTGGCRNLCRTVSCSPGSEKLCLLLLEPGLAAAAQSKRPCKQKAPVLQLLILNNLGLLVPFRRPISLLEAVKAKPPNSNNMTTKHF